MTQRVTLMRGEKTMCVEQTAGREVGISRLTWGRRRHLEETAEKYPWGPKV